MNLVVGLPSIWVRLTLRSLICPCSIFYSSYCSLVLLFIIYLVSMAHCLLSQPNLPLLAILLHSPGNSAFSNSYVSLLSGKCATSSNSAYSLRQICLSKQFFFIHPAILPLQTVMLNFSLANVPLPATLLTLSAKSASSRNSSSFTRQFCLFQQLS